MRHATARAGRANIRSHALAGLSLQPISARADDRQPAGHRGCGRRAPEREPRGCSGDPRRARAEGRPQFGRAAARWVGRLLAETPADSATPRRAGARGAAAGVSRRASWTRPPPVRHRGSERLITLLLSTSFVGARDLAGGRAKVREETPQVERRPLQFRRLIAGFCLIAAPAVPLVGALVHPQAEDAAAAHLAVVAQDPPVTTRRSDGRGVSPDHP